MKEFLISLIILFCFLSNAYALTESDIRIYIGKVVIVSTKNETICGVAHKLIRKHNDYTIDNLYSDLIIITKKEILVINISKIKQIENL